MRLKWFFPVLIMIFFMGCSFENDKVEIEKYLANLHSQPFVFHIKPPIYQPNHHVSFTAEKLRNPFVPKNKLSNQPKQPLQTFSLDALKWVGNVFADELYGLILAPNGIVYCVKIGDRIGKDRQKIINITQHGLVVKYA